MVLVQRVEPQHPLGADKADALGDGRFDTHAPPIAGIGPVVKSIPPPPLPLTVFAGGRR